MGSGAGTIISTPTIRTTNDMPIMPITSETTQEGLNLFPFLINAHYAHGDFYCFNDGGECVRHNGETRVERLTEFLTINKKYGQNILCFPEGIALEMSGKNIRILGDQSLLTSTPVWLMTKPKGRDTSLVQKISKSFLLETYSFIYPS